MTLLEIRRAKLSCNFIIKEQFHILDYRKFNPLAIFCNLARKLLKRASLVPAIRCS